MNRFQSIALDSRLRYDCWVLRLLSAAPPDINPDKFWRLMLAFVTVLALDNAANLDLSSMPTCVSPSVCGWMVHHLVRGVHVHGWFSGCLWY